MRKGLWITAVLALVAGSAPAGAQVVRVEEVRCGWLGFAYDLNNRGMVVAEVRQGSPAARAGLQRGDTVTYFNGATVRAPVIRLPRFETGDTVTLRVRREGRERELRIVAESRPGGCSSFGSIMIDADSLRNKMRVYFDSAMLALDSLHFPRIHIQRTDSGFFMYHDNDTTFHRIHPFDFDFKFDLDADSVFVWNAPGQPMVVRSWEVGERSVAGAEFSELNPELAAYFQGAREGLLVLKVADGTPAARAGLAAGDVVTAAAGSTVRSVADLRRAVSRDEPIRLDVVRKGARRELVLPRDR